MVFPDRLAGIGGLATVGFLAGGCGPKPDSEGNSQSNPGARPARVAQALPIETQAARDAIAAQRNELNGNPQYPPPSEWTQQVPTAGGKSETVITDEALRRRYGITITQVAPVPNGSGVLQYHETDAIKLFVRAGDGQVLNDVFGFLRPNLPPTAEQSNDLHILRALDIVMIDGVQMCKPGDTFTNMPFAADAAQWYSTGLNRFLQQLNGMPNPDAIRLPHVSLPHADHVNLPDKPALFLNFGGPSMSLKDIAEHVKAFREGFAGTNYWTQLSGVIAHCYESGGVAGLTVGPLPEFILSTDGHPITDANGMPFIRLRSRIYCVFDSNRLNSPTDLGSLLAHETSHVIQSLAQDPSDGASQGDHVGRSDDSAYSDTRASFAYRQAARRRFDRGDPNGYLFLFVDTRKKKDAIGRLPPPLQTAASVASLFNPLGLATGLVSSGLMYAFRKAPPIGPDGTMSRSRFVFTLASMECAAQFGGLVPNSTIDTPAQTNAPTDTPNEFTCFSCAEH
ncbi:hypothetical protein HY086_00205 [Candidatus Gottesmanbacteria bacterium]|nr:hypothetical protein [Candidatus Gottesmanbacteria bacterium]